MCIKKYTQVLGKKCKCRVGNFKMKKAGDTRQPMLMQFI